MASMYVEIDLNDVDDEELIEELEERGYTIRQNHLDDHNTLIEQIYQLRRLGRSYEHLMDPLIYEAVGKIV